MARTRYRRALGLAGVLTLGWAGPATAASRYWYVDHGRDRVLLIDANSIERRKAIVTYWTEHIIRDAEERAAMTKTVMRADCARQQLGWLGVAKYDAQDQPFETSTRRKAEMLAVPPDTLGRAELDFVCAAAPTEFGKEHGLFPLSIDHAAFADALLTRPDLSVSPRALHTALAADPAVPVIRSPAPGVATFGSVQTVPTGMPIVPPRAWATGPGIPLAADHDSNVSGIIYDIAYQGLRDGEIQFEVRGYSIDDMIHPASGQTESFPLSSRKVNVRDIAITIQSATAEAITYRVAIEREALPEADTCAPEGCETEITGAPEVSGGGPIARKP